MNSPVAPRVLVFGATGTLGRRIVSLLHESLAPDRVVAVARQSGDVRIDITTPQSLPLNSGDVVIDAVGPFLHDPRPIVRHCLRNGAHYLDISESAEFHQLAGSALDEHEHGEPATSAIVQGCSTIPAMVDVLMPHQADASRTVLLSVGIRNEASASLLYGLLRPLGRDNADGRWWDETATRDLLDGRTRRYGSHPSPFADGSTRFFCGLDRQAAYWVLRALSVVTRRVNDAWLFKLCRVAAPVAPLFAFVGTPRGSLRLEQGEEVIEIKAESDGLMIPALPAVWAALALLDRNDLAGITPLSELIDQPRVFANLRDRGYTVDHSHPA